MEHSDDMATSIQDLKNLRSSAQENLGQRIENQLENFDYNPDVIPQSTLQKAPPMRGGKIENYPTHQTVNQNNYYPRMEQGYVLPSPPETQVLESKGFIEGILSGIYQRIIDPIILTILFIIFAHRLVAKGSNSYLPFVGESPSTDFVSLGLRGFILSVIFLIIKGLV